ncbi:hypothetical protein DSECCO2_105270 [anaerobic digester metagenome]
MRPGGAAGWEIYRGLSGRGAGAVRTYGVPVGRGICEPERGTGPGIGSAAPRGGRYLMNTGRSEAVSGSGTRRLLTGKDGVAYSTLEASLPVDVTPISCLKHQDQEALILDREHNPAPIYPLPESRFGHNVDLAAEQEGKVHRKAPYAEKTPVGIQIDQDIDITVFPGFLPCHGPENPDVRMAKETNNGKHMIISLRKEQKRPTLNNILNDRMDHNNITKEDHIAQFR